MFAAAPTPAHRRGLIWLIAAAVALAVAVAVALGTGASAQNPTTRTLTFKELAKGSTFTHVRNTKTKSRRSNSQGDMIVSTNPLADATGKRIGKASIACTTTTGARNFMKSTLTCVAVYALRDGTLTLQANSSPGKSTTTGAVTGGTRAYANARGVFVSKQANTGAATTITLTD